MNQVTLSLQAIIAIGILSLVYFFLLTEKIHKVIVTMLGAALLIVFQIFRTGLASSQDGALQYISRNLDVLGFIIGMMTLVGIVRESGVFEAIAVWLVKLTRGNVKVLLVSIGYFCTFSYRSVV